MRATRRLLDDNLPPLLGGLDDWLGPVNAILEVVRRYRREVTGLSNLAAASQGVFFDFGTLDSVHYLRTDVAAHAGGGRGVSAAARGHPHESRTSSRAGIWTCAAPCGSFETRQCTAGVDAFLNPASSTDPLFLERTDGDLAEGQLFFDRINLFAFNDQLGTDDDDAAARATRRPRCSPWAPRRRRATTSMCATCRIRSLPQHGSRNFR